jgi:hypothetical protein
MQPARARSVGVNGGEDMDPAASESTGSGDGAKPSSKHRATIVLSVVRLRLGHPPAPCLKPSPPWSRRQGKA